MAKNKGCFECGKGPLVPKTVLCEKHWRVVPDAVKKVLLTNEQGSEKWTRAIISCKARWIGQAGGEATGEKDADVLSELNTRRMENRDPAEKKKMWDKAAHPKVRAKAWATRRAKAAAAAAGTNA